MSQSTNIINSRLSEAFVADTGGAPVALATIDAGNISNIPAANIVGSLANVTVTGTANLGSNANIIITGGSNGQVLTTNGSGNLSWTTPSGGGGGGGVATTVDITDTNGVTTIYYPTFVENRAANQIVRADVDLSYRTDTNTLTSGKITLTGTGTAVNASSGNILTNEVTGTKFNFLNGLNTVSLSGGGATSNYSLALPADAGSNGQVLSTDGTGNLSWSSGGISSYIANGASQVRIPVADGDIGFVVNASVSPIVINSLGLDVGDVSNLNIGGGSNGQVLTTYGNGTVYWANGGSGGGGSAVGNIGEVQLSDGNGAFTATSGFLFNSGVTNGQLNIGVNSVVSANGTMAIGANANASAANSTAIGRNASANGDNSTALGDSAITVGFQATALGKDANAAAWNSVAIGVGALASAPNAVAIGTNSYSFTTNTIVLGNATSQTEVTGNLTVKKISNLGPVANVIITGGSNGQVLSTDGTGNLSWANGGGISSYIANGASQVRIPVEDGDIGFVVNASVSPIVINSLGLDVGDVSNLNIGGGSNGQVLSTYGNGTVYWANGGGIPSYIANGASQVSIPVVDGNIGFVVNMVASPIVINSLGLDIDDVSNLKIGGGNNGQVLSTDGTGNLSWTNGGISSYIANGASQVRIPVEDGDIGFVVNASVSPIVINSLGLDVGDVSNLNIGGGSNAQVLTTYGNGTVYWATGPNAAVWVTAPISNVATGNAGEIAYDAGGNLYVCVSTNNWSKISGTTSW